jgi:hypothetical protein
MPLWPTLVALSVAAALPQLSATRVERGPVLDGKLDDLAWKRATSSDAFTQKLPHPGKDPGERTVVRVLYDDEAIYVGVDCEQTAAEIIARLTRRDRSVEADSVTVALDTRADGRSAVELEVNAAGVLADALRYNDTDFSREWDEIWEARTARTPHGWSAEFRIPLRILRFRDGQPRFGMQVRRRVTMRQEVDEWAFIPRDAGGEVSRYGKLEGLVGLRSEAPIELRPFVVGALRYSESESAAHATPIFPTGSAGVDIKWHPSQSLTLDATLFPDFGQVDADQAVLNLTNFEQFYPEKRPFFLEGTDALSTPLQLLYTRRLGRAPAEPSLPDGEEMIGNPRPATVWGAAKLTGELGEGTAVGELLGITAPVTVDVRAPGGRTLQRVAEPMAAYKVLRLRRDFGPKLSIGMIATAKSRMETPLVYPRVASRDGGPLDRALCPGGQLVRVGQRCLHDAYVAGVDGRWRSPSGDYVISGQAVGSLIHDGAPRTMRDGTVIGAGDVGPAGRLRIAKEGGENFVFSAEYQGHGRRVDYNDVGYMRRQNLHSLYGVVEWRTLTPWWKTLETHTSLELTERDTLDGLTQERQLLLGNSTRFSNFWQIFAGVHAKPSRYDDREVGDGTALERAGLFGAELWFSTDKRLALNGELWTMVQAIRTGINVESEGRLTVRPLPQFDLELLPTFQYTRGEPRYAATVSAGHVFGRLRAQSLGLTLRATYTFTPRLSLQAYGQLFLEAQHYSDLMLSPARGRGRVARLDEMRPFREKLEDNPDYEGGTFNANLVMRWEYRLGSTLFLVYTHAQSDGDAGRPGARIGFDTRWISPRPSEDSLLAKLSYWWG